MNHLLGTEILPVGVNPITAVPTRLVHGAETRLTEVLAGQQARRCPIEALADYASEEGNPGNERGVTKLVVELPSPRRQGGRVLVDTPGLGALARAGAAETRWYLPQCDLGILLISAISPMNEEDLGKIEALTMAGILVMVLLSKADLFSPNDRERAMAYTTREVLANLHLTVDIQPVSTAGNEEELLTLWFRDRLQPLFDRHRELADESVRRKAGVLREAVAAALRVRLGRGGTSAAATVPLEEAERRLRAAAGAIEEARRHCMKAADSVGALSATAFEACVNVVVDDWATTAHGSDASARASQEVGRLAANAVAQIPGRLGELAEELEAALVRAEEVLGEPPPSSSDGLRRYVREMPRVEAVLPEMRVARPWFLMAGRPARLWAARRLRAELVPALESAFESYGRAMETWCRRVLGTLQERFEASAGAYRAQLVPRMDRSPLLQAQRERLQGHLAELDGLAGWRAAPAPPASKP